MRTRLPELAVVSIIIAAGSSLAATDPTGKQDLGIDITRAGATAADNQSFVKSLSADQQKAVMNGCTQVLASPGDHAATVVSFCNNVKPLQAAQNSTAASTTTTQFGMVPQDAVLSYNLLGLEIYNNANEDVGEIKDLVLDKGQLVGFIASVGGFLGLGEHYVVLNPASVRISYDNANAKWRASMDATKDQVKNAPEFKYEGRFKRAG